MFNSYVSHYQRVYYGIPMYPAGALVQSFAQGKVHGIALRV